MSSALGGCNLYGTIPKSRGFHSRKPRSEGNKLMKNLASVAIVLTAAFGLAACTQTQQNTTGAAVGAGTGAAVGGSIAGTPGAALGGAGGAAAGVAVSEEMN